MDINSLKISFCSPARPPARSPSRGAKKKQEKKEEKQEGSEGKAAEQVASPAKSPKSATKVSRKGVDTDDVVVEIVDADVSCKVRSSLNCVQWRVLHVLSHYCAI